MANDRTSEKLPVLAGASGESVPVESAGLPHVIEEPDGGYTPAGVPTLEGVREKIESRYGAALGATELAQDTPEGRAATERFEKIQKAAAEKLKEIRASMDEPD